jgi:hypothetical protein
VSDGWLGWLPIETAPKDGTPVLLWLEEPIHRKYVVEGRCPNITIGFNGAANPDYSPAPAWVSIETETYGSMGGDDTGYMEDTSCIDVFPTHWMPLPTPPPVPYILTCDPPKRRNEAKPKTIPDS